MALRMIETYLPQDAEIEQLIGDQEIIYFRREKASDGGVLIKILLQSESTEAVMSSIEKFLIDKENYRIIMLPVEASFPKPKMPENVPLSKLKPESERISRDELYSDIEDSSRLTRVYLVAVVLSAAIAAMGVITDNIIIIIGAMVIAPLLGPNVALSFASAVGDVTLGKLAIKTNLAGIISAVIFSAVIGYIVPFDPGLPEIQRRISVDLANILLALASGIAGVLAFTTGISATIVGVMVAASLIPVLAVTGLLIGAGYWQASIRSMLLFAANVICINLAGVLTFIVQGIRPLTWWEEKRARKSRIIAISIWVSVLTALIIVLIYSREIRLFRI